MLHSYILMNFRGVEPLVLGKVDTYYRSEDLLTSYNILFFRSFIFGSWTFQIRKKWGIHTDPRNYSLSPKCWVITAMTLLNSPTSSTSRTMAASSSLGFCPRKTLWPTLLSGFTMEEIQVLFHSCGSHNQVLQSTPFLRPLFLH